MPLGRLEVVTVHRKFKKIGKFQKKLSVLYAVDPNFKHICPIDSLNAVNNPIITFIIWSFEHTLFCSYLGNGFMDLFDSFFILSPAI